MVQTTGVRLDRRGAEAWVDGRRVQLTAKELIALELLLANAGKVVGKDDLASVVWPENEGITTDGTIEKLVSRLRHKLESDPGAPRYLRTLRGLGYRLDQRSITAAGRLQAPLVVPPYAWRGLVIAGLLLVSAFAGRDRLQTGTAGRSEPVSAVMMVPGADDGPDAVRMGIASATYGSGQRFAVRIDYGQLVEPYYAASYGPTTAVHMTKAPPHEPRSDFGTCCFIAPSSPGSYVLRVEARTVPGGELLAVELRYEVARAPD